MEHRTAVDGEDLSAHEGGVVAGEEGDGTHQVLRIGVALQHTAGNGGLPMGREEIGFAEVAFAQRVAR